MSDEGATVPDIEDFMKWHIYIGYCMDDAMSVQKLCELLRSRGLTCCLRNELDVREESVVENIRQGVNFSHKCLLYVSQSYIEDSWTREEMDEVERKQRYLEKTSVVAIVESSVEEQQLERFRKFSTIRLQENETLSREHFNRYSFLSDFELKPCLTSMPKGNIGVGVAITYFYGFLQLLLPGVIQGLIKELNLHSIDSSQVVKKMLIIIPETVNSPLQLTEPGILKQTNYTVKVSAHRSGREKRDYSIAAHELTVVDGRQDTYYLVGDIPACLYSLREAYDRQMSGLSLDELYQARNEFVLTLKALLNHPDNLALYADQWEILIWPDAKENPKQRRLSEFLYQEIVKRRLMEVEKRPIVGPVQATLDTETFRIVDGVRHYPVYRTLKEYDMSHSPRGLCVIINNSKFPEGSRLAERTGAKAENEKLKKLFSDLRFEVRLHENLTSWEMKMQLEEYQQLNHSQYDAFVCCILSHGSRGHVCATDGLHVRVMTLMELFYDTNCPQLKGKLKMFFIEACQSDESYALSEVAVVPENPQVPLVSNASPATTTTTTTTTVGTNSDLCPPTVDFVVSYATLPNSVAWADRDTGGLYVDALCKYLRCDMEIDFALRAVNNEVRRLLVDYSERENCSYSAQIPCHFILPPYHLIFLCH